MPTYEYRCRTCGHSIELLHAMTEDGPSVCERCGGPVQRVLHPAGIIFKGSGFYATDSRSKPAPDASAPDASPSGTSTESSGPPGPPTGGAD